MTAGSVDRGADVADFPDVASTFTQCLGRVYGEVDPRVVLRPDAREGVPPGAPASSPERPRYELRGEIGRGGVGIVLEVFDNDIHRRLAMKVLRRQAEGAVPGEVPDVPAEFLARFLEEAQITGQLDHPAVVPVHELGVDSQGRMYFTMRLVRGRDLREIFEDARQRRGGWTPTRAVGVLIKVCEAMAYAHAKGVVHRDLKPANVMVGRYGEVYVMDWGLAKVLGRRDTRDIRPRPAPEFTLTEIRTDRQKQAGDSPDSPLLTMDGAVLGTPAYMAPEQAKGQLELVGATSDVYSVGAMLYHLLTGQMPFVEPGAQLGAQLVLALVIAAPLRPVHELAPDVPSELAAICAKAMARDPGQRYAGMAEMAEDLHAWLERRVVRAYRTGAVAELGKWVERNQALAATVLIALLLVVGGSGAVSVFFAQKNREILRLADAQRLQALEARASELWPAAPETVPAYEAWLAEAGALARRLPLHRGTLDSMRADAGAVLGAGTWTLASAEGQWQHDTLVRLVADLEAFERGVQRDVEDRAKFARTVRERTETGEQARALWDRACASISDPVECPLYEGCAISPQLGLLPLGPDPRSGLWEFAHLQTGVAPVRDEKGNLRMSGECGLVLVLVPGGSFDMGAEAPSAERPAGSPNADPWAKPGEGPVHAVRLAPFFLSKYEMTQGQWLRATGANPSAYQQASAATLLEADPLLHPVERVSWLDCERVLSNLGIGLPTEAQWEYAARAGTTEVWWSGNESGSLVRVGNLADLAARKMGAVWSEIDEWPEKNDGFSVHAPVAYYRPNAFGLHDVHGNVGEWCRDMRAGTASPYSIERLTPGDGEHLCEPSDYRISRGGSFRYGPDWARSGFRGHELATQVHDYLGVRPARPLEE